MKINKQVLECWKLTEKEWKKYARHRPCEHRYPYFQRWYDNLSKSGKSIERHCYCFICEKEYIIRLRISSMHMPSVNFGLEKDRETISKLKRNLPIFIKKYINNVKEKEGK